MRTAVMLLLAVCAAAGQDNLILNPGFETAGQDSPLGWRQLRGETITWPTDGGHEGQTYARFTDTKATEGVSLESRHLPARPGGTYHATAWFRTSEKIGPGIYIQFHDDLGARFAETHARAQGPTDGWVQVEVSAVAPPESFEASVLLYAYTGDVGGFDADNVTLTVTGGGTPGSTTYPRAEPQEKSMVELGSRLELFVDDYLLDDLTGDARRVLHHPVPQNVALAFDEPYEGPTSFYVTVMPDGDKVRLYYRGSGSGNAHECACYAESSDGISFTRPKLGLFEDGGNTDNSIIWQGAGSHNFTPFLDGNPAAPADQKYKALCSAGPKASLVPCVSPDGIHWTKLQTDPVITEGAFDSQNLAFWDDVRGEYRAYVRDFKDGVRTIRTCTSDDFVHWTEPAWLDYGKAPHEHLYTNATTPYFRAPHLFVAFPKRFVPNRQKDPTHKEQGLSDGVFMSSRDGLHFERWREGFIRPGPDPENWTERNIGTAFGIVQTSETEMSLYWVEHYRHPTCRLRRGTLRLDGFVSVSAGSAGGEVLTRPLTFEGSRLVVNYSTSAAGSIRFELCDEHGEPLPGFGLVESSPKYGDEIAASVTWDGADLASLAGKPVRLRVRLKDADLYAVRFTD